MRKEITKFQEKVYKAAKKIPRGKVATYQGIARAIGNPRGCRAVGNALGSNPFAPQVPCHRVVKSTGEIGNYAGGKDKKIEMLQEEGVKVEKGKVVDFSKRLFRFR